MSQSDFVSEDETTEDTKKTPAAATSNSTDHDVEVDNMNTTNANSNSSTSLLMEDRRRGASKEHKPHAHAHQQQHILGKEVAVGPDGGIDTVVTTRGALHYHSEAKSR